MYSKFTALCIVLYLATCANAACSKPEIKQQTFYTTTQGTIVSQVAFVTEFSVQCSNAVENLNLFAELNGRIISVPKIPGDKYQISWTEELNKASSGNYVLNLYDEEGFAGYRKAQRSGENTNSVKPLAKVTLYHPGTYKGAWVKSELLATILVSAAAYVAFATRTKLTS